MILLLHQSKLLLVGSNVNTGNTLISSIIACGFGAKQAASLVVLVSNDIAICAFQPIREACYWEWLGMCIGWLGLSQQRMTGQQPCPLLSFWHNMGGGCNKLYPNGTIHKKYHFTFHASTKKLKGHDLFWFFRIEGIKNGKFTENLEENW